MLRWKLGKDRTILRKDRFPSLIREIQAYIEIHQYANPPSKREELIKKRSVNRDHKVRLDELIRQRDHAMSQLGSANLRLVELEAENAKLRLQLEEIQPRAKVHKL